MNFRDNLRALRKGWAVVLAFVTVGVAAGVLVMLTTTKLYQATVQVFVATSESTDAAQLQAGQTFITDRVQSYTAIANAPSVTEPVAEALGVKGLTAQALATKVTADAPQNKVLLNIHVQDEDPRLAARMANAVATQFSTVVEKKFEQTRTDGDSVVKLTVVHPATVPSSPVVPNKVVDIGLGLVLGLLVGIGVVVARDLLDNTVKGPKDFEDVGVPVLGMIPLDKRTARTPIAFRGDPHSTRSEAYRQLRTNLQFVKVDTAPRVIAVTSAIPSEGKSTTSMNLAAALAEAGHRVVLIEADLRRPTIGKTLGLVTDVGFTTVLIGRTSVLDALQNIGRNLAVLTSGPVPPNPSELLNSEQARNVVAEVARHADYVVIDTAPLLPVADGAEVAAMAQATVVVHRAGKTTREQARRSVAALEKVGETPVGVVLNMVSRTAGRYDNEYNYYYTYRPDRSGHGRRTDARDELSPADLEPQLPQGNGGTPATYSHEFGGVGSAAEPPRPGPVSR